jgi:hypothetical protein
VNGFALVVLTAALAQPADDYSVGTFQAQARAIESTWPEGYRGVPLDVKAEFFEWHLWRYHLSDLEQICNRAFLPERAGDPPRHRPSSDTSTWNGALLAALSYKYAATRDGETLTRIATLLRGLHRYFLVTRQPGLPARTMTTAEDLVTPEMQPGEIDGRPCWYWADPAKGTVNQLASGYAALLIHAYADLPPDVQQLARGDATDVARHLVDHDYHLTHRNGQRTSYGDLTPLIGSMGVPFNAQVAYAVVATGHAWQADDDAARERIAGQFDRLRGKHHVYYEEPLRSPVLPQAVAASPFLKGMNDRNHAMNAAFTGLQLERLDAARDGREIDREFAYQLGQTQCFGIELLADQRNALCSFQWAALVDDPQLGPAMLRRPDEARAVAQRALVEGVEQLRRFRLERLATPGEAVKTGRLQWVDAWGVDEYYWKADPTQAWQASGPPGNGSFAAIDYLHAYWLLRAFGLDRHPAVVERHADVLWPTPELTPSPPRDAPFPRAAGRAGAP